MYRTDISSRPWVEAVDERGETVGRGLADRYRADVQRAGYGDGHYGFAISCNDVGLVDRLRISCGEASIEWRKPRLRPRSLKPRTFETGGHILHLDCVPAMGRLTGWALERREPGERRLLRLLTGQQLIAEQRATLFRRDCVAVGLDGFHGFSLPLPRSIGSVTMMDVASGVEFRIT